MAPEGAPGRLCGMGTVPTRSLYSSPAYYSMLFDGRSDDVAFYVGLARRSSIDCEPRQSRPVSVLEYGVGAGRVAIPLARAGFEVVGVDTSAEMLDTLSKRASEEPDAVQARLSWRWGDARQLSFDRRFELVICPFNGLAHHVTRSQIAAFLARAREHLAPGGLFAFDVWLPNPALLSGAATMSPVFRHPESGEPVRCAEVFRYEPFTQVLTSTITLTPVASDAPPETLTLALRQLYPEETIVLLERHGLEVTWRTTRFRLPPSPETTAPSVGSLPLEPESERGEMLAYVCRV